MKILWDYVEINGDLLFKCRRCGNIIRVKRPFTRKMYDALICIRCRNISIA